jgi:hypothetical protein
MLDLLARAGVLGQFGSVGVGQAPRAGVQCADLGVTRAGLNDVIAVEDDHPTRTVLAVALEGAVSVDQQWSRAGRLGRYVAHSRRDHLNRRQLRIRCRARDWDDRRRLVSRPAPHPAARTVLVWPATTASTSRHWHRADRTLVRAELTLRKINAICGWWHVSYRHPA